MRSCAPISALKTKGLSSSNTIESTVVVEPEEDMINEMVEEPDDSENGLEF